MDENAIGYLTMLTQNSRSQSFVVNNALFQKRVVYIKK